MCIRDRENEKDLVDIPGNVKVGLEIIPVAMVDEVLSAALVREPLPSSVSGSAEEAAGGVAIAETPANGDDIRAH